MWSPFHKRHPVGRARAPSDIASQCLRCSWDMCASLFDCWHLVGRSRPSSDITSQCLRCSWDMCASLFDCWYLVGRARRARRRLYASNRKMQMRCKIDVHCLLSVPGKELNL